MKETDDVARGRVPIPQHPGRSELSAGQDHAEASDPANAETVGEQAVIRGANVHAYIGRQLRAVYDDVASQPVPDRFLELMKQLEGKTPQR